MRPFWKNAAAVSARLAAAPELLVTLDFDGTLAALAGTPSQARLRPEFKAALRALAAAPGVSVFILSGRALKDVRGLAGLRGLYYGGNHGIEIRGPGFAWHDAAAAKARRQVAAIAAGVRESFPPDTGVLVENKIFSASVHYRNLKAACRRGFFSRMKALRSAVGESSPGSRAVYWRRGHKVFELLPRDAARKDRAVARVAARLGHPLCVAVGDDLSDEDMFSALGARGLSIRVRRKVDSSAVYFLSGQADVLRLLSFITAARQGAPAAVSRPGRGG